MKRFLRRGAAMLLALAILLLGGCAEGEGEVQKVGKKLIKEYLAGRGEIEECYADVQRPDADKLIVSDYAKGTFRMGGESYEFAVNVVTGEIWTSERTAECTDCCLRLLEARLGLEPAACKARCAMWTHAPAWQTPNEDYPDETAYLGQVVPVGIEDMDAYAAQAIADGNIRVDAHIFCTELLSEDRWTLDDTADWDYVTVCLYAVDELPQEEITYDLASGFKGTWMQLTSEEIVRKTDG